MTNIVKTSMATVNEANAATASGDATSADALFSALFSLMKPGASEDEVTAALDAAVLAEHLLCLQQNMMPKHCFQAMMHKQPSTP